MLLFFAEENSSLVHIYNKKIYIFFIDKGPRQELDNTAIATKAEHSINFSIAEIIFFNSALKWKKQSFICKIPQKIYQFQIKKLQKIDIDCF